MRAYTRALTAGMELIFSSQHIYIYICIIMMLGMVGMGPIHPPVNWFSLETEHVVDIPRCKQAPPNHSDVSHDPCSMSLVE